jgi:hypothetical protein
MDATFIGKPRIVGIELHDLFAVLRYVLIDDRSDSGELSLSFLALTSAEPQQPANGCRT